MKIRLVLFLILTNALFLPAKAQHNIQYSISGTVKDANTGETLIGASVVLLASAGLIDQFPTIFPAHQGL